MYQAFAPVTVPELFTPGRYGLMSAITWVPEVKGWQAGIQFDTECSEAAVTINPCVISGVSVPGKTATYSNLVRGAIPFTLFAEKDCSPPGDNYWEVATTEVTRALNNAAPTQMERVLWTGVAPTGGAKNIYPNLTSTSQLFASEYRDLLLQPSATLISGVPLDVTEGLGILEETAGQCYDGELTIHVPVRIAAALAARGLCFKDGNVLRTYAGNIVAVGRGYDSTYGTGGTNLTNAGRTWMWATSPIFGIRGPVKTRNNTVESFARDVNTLKMIAEQTVVLGWQCCLAGVLITTGGETAGEPFSPLQDT